MSTPINCPACGEALDATDLHPDNGCLLGVALTTLGDRHREVDAPPPITPEHVAELDLSVPDLLWDQFGGPMLDWLEDRFGEQTALDFKG